VGSMANQFAAMPSLHFGWAVLVAYGVVRALHTRWRWLIVAHPIITLAAIVITANHYWLDALVALALIGAAMALQREGDRRALAAPGDKCDMDVTCRPAGSAPAKVRAGRSW
jgi:hypothetical protein